MDGGVGTLLDPIISHHVVEFQVNPRFGDPINIVPLCKVNKWLGGKSNWSWICQVVLNIQVRLTNIELLSVELDEDSLLR